MTSKPIKAAAYLRVSTLDGQTTDNQRRELEQAAERRGWNLTMVYEDAGISGAKGRDKRPGFDRMLKDAVKGKFDVLMSWSVDRLGRSLQDLVGMLGELHGAKVDLFLQQQGIDTTTPGGKAMFQMLGVFAEFERNMIQARVKAGMDRARAEQNAGMVRRGKDGQIKKLIGRPSIAPKVCDLVRASLESGIGINRTAATLGVGNAVVQRIKAEMLAA